MVKLTHRMRTAGTSPHQKNAVRLVHVCLATVMKVALPKAVAMEHEVALTALQECLFHGA